ncbi:AraC family transcriptional regulator [cyanobacterium TDX16]|nr:AraC family transcriptional regulator [cyanobacterium TDX16]
MPVPESLLPHLRRARDLIDRDYAEPLDLDGLAATAMVSKYHFLRSFREAYGTTPAVYLTERRIERAQDLLRSTNLTVTEVCMLVGYSSVGSFSSRFREVVGMTPSDYQGEFAGAGVPHIPGCWIFMHRIRDRRVDLDPTVPTTPARSSSSATSEKQTLERQP